MLKILIFFLFVISELFSITLNSTYYVNSNNIKLLDVVPDAKYDVTIYKIDSNRYTKKIKSKQLVKLLQKHGIKSIETSSRYVKFIKKSPIDTSKIEKRLIQTYKNKYSDINIISIIVVPRGYIKSLPENYELLIPRKAHLSKDGTLSIKTPEHKKIFFDYTVNAKLSVYLSKKTIKKGEKISLLNTTQKNILFDKFRAIPVTTKQLGSIQIKHNTKQNSIITMKGVETLNLIRKGYFISVNLQNKNINISFSAKALQNGKLNDIITVQKSSGQRLQAKIVGKNRVEIK